MDTHFNEEDLKKLCAEWQKTLRLQDWTIYTEICRARDMPENATGNNKIDVLKKKSVIAVLDEIDYNPNSAWGYDPEKILVHELVHLYFETGSEITEIQHVALEQGVDILARALVEMKRATATC